MAAVPMDNPHCSCELTRVASPSVAARLAEQELYGRVHGLAEQKLAGLSLSELRKRARRAGVAEDLLEAVLDEDDPKAALRAILSPALRQPGRGGGREEEQEEEQEEQELSGLSLSQLRKRARAAGVSAAQSMRQTRTVLPNTSALITSDSCGAGRCRGGRCDPGP